VKAAFETERVELVVVKSNVETKKVSKEDDRHHRDSFLSIHGQPANIVEKNLHSWIPNEKKIEGNLMQFVTKSRSIQNLGVWFMSPKAEMPISIVYLIILL